MAASIGRLKVRADFLRVAAARRKFATPGLVLQAAANSDGNGQIRVGYTASRKVGGAVVRNRARRRLRAAVGVVMERARSDMDYVVIARRGTPNRPYGALLSDLETALRRIGAWQPRPETSPRQSGRSKNDR
ncbi:MAG: ribonuclease P protein component [Alphaproteobacteria bacterium]